MKLDISSALFTSGGVDFCPVLGLKSLAFDSQGQMIYCCDAQASDSVIGSLSEHSLAELLSKRVEVTQSIQKERILRITRGQMGEGFNTCTFCAEYFQ